MTASFRCLEAETERATFDWKSAMHQFAIVFGERFTLARG
ncbi:transposase mutator type [Burkholderia sp. H160]|nr:transposase mutator type [Burkholderia sp. H160]